MGASLVKSCFEGSPDETVVNARRPPSVRSLKEESSSDDLVVNTPKKNKKIRESSRRREPQLQVSMSKRVTTSSRPNTAYTSRRRQRQPRREDAGKPHSYSEDAHLVGEMSPVYNTSHSRTGSESIVSDDSFGYHKDPSTILHSPSAKEFMQMLPNKYEVIGIIGAGATAICYKVRRTSDDATLVCKVIDKRRLNCSPSGHGDMLEQLRMEVEVLKRLDHPNICRLEEAIENENFIIIVMEYLEGGELFDMIIKRGRLSELHAKGVAKDVLSALQHMHDKGIVHRDIKPENLLFASTRTGDWTIKLIDFGFATSLSDKEGGTAKSFLGTSGYLAPEILRQQPYTSTVDMWAFGVLLYLLLCGRLPFAATKRILPQHKITSFYTLVFPEKLWFGISSDSKDLLRNLLIQDPTQRYTAKEALNHRWLNE